MEKKYLIIVLIIICLVLSMANQLQNYNCEPFAKPQAKPAAKPQVKTTTVTTTTTAVKTSSSLKPPVIPPVIETNKLIHLTVNNAGNGIILSGRASDNNITTISTCNISYQKSYLKSPTKHLIVFPDSNLTNISKICQPKLKTFGQIKLDRKNWSSNFNNGMIIFAVLQPLKISTSTKPDYPHTGLINIPKQHTDKNYYPGPLLLYNVTYCFGNGTDIYDCGFKTGEPCFWSGHNNKKDQLLQLYTLIIKPNSIDNKIYVYEYINDKLIFYGKMNIFSDDNPYAPIYIGNCDLGNNAFNVFIGTLAELVIYNNVLSDNEINTNWTYLCNKWSIPEVKLPPPPSPPKSNI